MKPIGLAVLFSMVLAFVFVFVPYMMPAEEASGVHVPPPPVDGATALSGDSIDLDGTAYAVERLTCPEIGSEAGDAAQAALAALLASGDTKCLPINETVVRCQAMGKDLAQAMVDAGYCRKD